MSQELKKRWKSECPHFFKKVINLGLTIGAVGTTLVALPIALPTLIVTVGGYMVATGVVTATVAKFTKI